MDFVRRRVSGNKIRYQDESYDLDISYITPRILAMSLPGEGIRKIYRNSIDQVSKFLNEKHGHKYRIFNLSGVKYDYEKFGMNVCEFPWKDHYPPPVDLLFQACSSIHYWLCQDIENVIVVNCNAGKGRTGTLICCYFIYCGRIPDPHHSLLYYKNKRFVKGGGVTQPSQVRYVHYFADILNGKVKGPMILQLSSIQMKTAPHIHNSSFKPIFEIRSGTTLIYTNKQVDRKMKFKDDWENETIHNIETISIDLLLQGDIQCNINHWGLFKTNKICRFTFNTSFVPISNELVFEKNELDPDSFRLNKNVSDRFAVILLFKRVCYCIPEMEFNDRCVFCKRNFEHDELEKWMYIKEILKERVLINPSIILFGIPEEDDIDKILAQSCNGGQKFDNEI